MSLSPIPFKISQGQSLNIIETTRLGIYDNSFINLIGLLAVILIAGVLLRKSI